MAAILPSLGRWLAFALAAWLLILHAVATAAGTASIRTEFQRSHQFKVAVLLGRRDAAALAGQQLRLYASADRGRSWQFVQAASTSASAFSVTVVGDGEYLFALRLALPEERDRADATYTATYRAIVDTEPPKLELVARRGASGEIIAHWRATDLWLDRDSFQLTAGPEGQPQPVAVQPDARPPADLSALEGTASWWPRGAAGVMSVRGHVADRAGNPAIKTVQVEVPDSAAPADNGPPPLAAGRTYQPAADEAAAAAPAQEASLARDRPAASDPGPTADEPTTSFGPRDTARPGEPQAWPPDEQTGQSLERKTGIGRSDSAKPPAIFQPSNAPPEDLPSPSAIHPPVTRKVGPPEAAAEKDQLPPGERPRVVGTRRVSLQYDVAPASPSDAVEVELWSTEDGGRTWTTHGIDPDNRSPFTTTLGGQGLYGFRITVKSRNAAAAPRPAAGDLPDLWVVVDETAPLAAIMSAAVRTGERGRELVIRYEAADARLAARPVAIFYSEQSGGPWQTVGVGLAATGVHAWPLDARLPERVYLRLEVQDEAGNVGAFETASPVWLDDEKPTGQLRGVDAPGTKSARAAWPQYRR